MSPRKHERIILRVAPLVLVSGFILAGFQNCASGFSGGSTALQLSGNTILTGPGDDLPPPPLTTPYNPKISDRYYVHSLFNALFGPTSDSVDQTHLSHNVVDFGSNCSVYENYNVVNSKGNTSQGNPLENCGINLTAELAAFDPKPTVTRQANLAYACALQVENPAGLTYFLSQVSSDPIPLPTDANLTTVFSLFYRNMPPPSQDVLDAMRLMFPQQNVQVSDWRAPIYSLCVSSYWQGQ